MSLAPGQQALMYALGGLARGGATRGGYISRRIYIAIDGGQTGSAAARRVLIASLTIQDQLNETPNTCSFTVQGDRPTEGSDIVIAFGSINAGTRLFAGTVLRVQEVYVGQKPANVLYHVEGIDYTWGLNARLVIARYRSQSATTIARDLVTRFAPAGYTAQVADGLPPLDEISFTNTPVMDAFAQLAGRIGGYAKCDYFRRVRLWIDLPADAAPAPLALTPTHPSLEEISASRDFSQLVTRAIVEGGGVNARGPVPVGETRLPVEDVAWYPPGGGWVVSGPQRIRYTGVVAAGDGAMASAVGGATGTTAPGNAPTITTQAGAGLPLGGYKYAYTWVTASGETLPSPQATWNPGSAAGPTVAPTATLATGTGLDSGRYRYAYTWVTGSGAITGETVPSPVTEIITTTTGTVSNPSGIPTCAQTTGTLPPGNYTYAFTYVTATGETQGSNQRLITIYATSGVLVSNIAIGPAGVTARRVYRSPAGSTLLKLLTTLSNNTATALPGPDNTPDGSLGVTLPTTNTTGTTNQRVTLSGIATGPSGTTARRVYRTTVGGTALYLLTTLSNNTTTTLTDATADALLGAGAPATGTATLSQAVLGGIVVGPTNTTSRKVYRTAVNSPALKLLTTIANNTATGIAADTLPDASLGAAVPTSDTSGLVGGSGGQVNAGATTIPVASVAPFAPEGWALVAGSLIRYTGVSGTSLTGIPASGIGSLGISIPYNSVIAVVSQLTGIPASGAGAIVEAILQGDPVNLLVILDDTDAQAVLAAALGSGDGVRESYLQDRRISAAEATSRAKALLAQKSVVLETVRYRVRDSRTFSGTTITVDLPPPTDVHGTYQIQDVTISGFLGVGLNPIYTVTASSARFSFEDLLRQSRRRI